MSDTDADTAAAPDWRRGAGYPDVDVVMPIRNEAEHLADAVAAVRRQEYPGRVRVFVAVGPSSDDTQRVAARLAEHDDDLVVLANPSGQTPAALNIAIRAGSAPVVVRVDGRSELSAGYIRRAVETMRRTGAANVGGRQVPAGVTPFERAVAAATTSRLGTGGAAYRVGGSEGPVDTVYLGVFDRVAIEAVDLFDERLIRNQDYELNIRLRTAGGTVWFDPELWVGYRPRGTWKALAKQYHDYGYWKAAVVRMHPSSLRFRQLLPPIAVAGMTAATFHGLRRPRWAIVPVAAAVAVSAEGVRASQGRMMASICVATVLATIPVAWTTGFVRGVGRSPIR